MISKAGIIGAILGGMAVAAHAYTSPYSAMAVPGDHNSWNPASSMVLMADNTWVCTQTLSAASGSFKFAANGSWAINWGGIASIARVPAVASAPAPGGGNLGYTGFTPGAYRFIFNDSTKEFRVEWAGASPLPVPVVTNLALIGDFNSWTPNANSLLTNHPAPNTNQWSRSIELQDPTSFQFLVNSATNDLWGAPEATTLTLPVTNGSACGKVAFTLSGYAPGTFLFTLNVSNLAFTISQTATQEFTITTMSVQGNLVATNNPPGNMTKIGASLWESDHHLTNTASATLRFSANNGVQLWGLTNGAANFTLPAGGTMATGLTNFATVTGMQPGRYRITFDHITGAFSLRRQYLDNSLGTGANLLKNPGFEITSDPTGGYATDWGSFQAWPKRVADGFAPHSGNWCGAIHGRLYPEWQNFGSYAQDVLVESGRTYRASAWFKATPDWSAGSMQIKLEWRDNSFNPVGEDAVFNIPALTGAWTKYSVEGTAPTNARYAHVVFLCAEAETTGTMHIDDAEMKIFAGRTQNFDSWGTLQSYAPFAPDWSVTSGKVVYNIPPGRPPAGVFISQYVEGTGNNKAVEIYNGTLADLDLAAGGYVLQQYNNGATTPSVTMPLSGTVAAGATLVVGRPNSPTNYAPDLAIGNLPNLLTNKNLTFNGDDVVVLRQGGAGGTVVDRVGQVGTNATGSIWSRNTQDRTLSRKQTIFTGTLGIATAPFPLDEWNITAKDSFAGLGGHDISYVDPNEPYTPSGYSLIMNTNAILMSGELPGGIGDLNFWYRTETTNTPVTVLVESGPSESGPWTLQHTIADFTRAYFTNLAIAINRPDHLYVRWRQTNGAPNRFRIDEINASVYSSVRRLEDFNAWTDPSFALPGIYSRYGWTIQNATIAPSSGVSSTRAALISPPDGAVVSPAFEGGVGEVRFWTRAAEADAPAQLLLQTTVDGGSNWITQASFNVTTAATYATWLYLPENLAQARLVFDPGFNSGDVLLDDVEVRLPALYRNQNFDGWPTRSGYTTDSYQGWIVSNSIVDAQNAYLGQVARLNTTVGNYIQSPFLPGGIGTLSFQTRKWAASDAAFTLQVQTSPDAKTWTTLTSVSAVSTNYEQFTWFVGNTNHFFVRLFHSAGAVRVLVDDIRIGAVQPRPQVLVTPGLDPDPPPILQPMRLTADVLTRYGASILSVTGTYRIASGGFNYLAMAPDPSGLYASPFSIPGQNTNTMIRYQVTVRYAGIGAAPGSTGFSTNTFITDWVTNFIPPLGQGNVWINEFFYAPYGDEFFDGYNHEYIELCGLAGIDIGNWKIQLAFGRDADIALNGGQPVYATYTIPANTVFTNMTNGFSFYVLGDQELADADEPINQILTILVPTNVNPWSESDRDHIHDNVGVIRLLNQYGHVVQAFSYDGYAPGADRVPQSQAGSGETNSIGLIYTGSAFADFEWGKGDLTIGDVNAGQTLEEPPPTTNVYAYAWHHQSLKVTPNRPDVPPFFLLDPYPPAHWDTLSIYYGYSNTAYASPRGTLHHRTDRTGPAWAAATMNLRDGSLDSNGHAYVVAQIQDHTYQRLETLEYVIEVDPNRIGVEKVYLGSDGGGENLSTIYTNLAAAQASPFTYHIPIADVIVITNLAVSATNVTLWTGGNDFEDPLVHFNIQVTTNILTQYRYLYDANTNIIGTTTNTFWGVWTTTNYTGYTNIYREWIFNIRRSSSDKPARFYRVIPLWP